MSGDHNMNQKPKTHKRLHVVIQRKSSGKFEWSIRSTAWGELGRKSVFASGWLFDLETVRFIAWMNLQALTKGSGPPAYACGESYTWTELL